MNFICWEKEHDKNKIKVLTEEKDVLTLSQKNNLHEHPSLQAEMQVLKGNYSSQNLNILSEQLSNALNLKIKIAEELEAANRERNKIKKKC